MTYVRLTDGMLKALVGEGVDIGSYDYARNKARGGASGKKGARYEDYVTAYLIAELLCEMLRRQPCMCWPRLISQDFGFVDDVTVASGDATVFHQLKNVQALSWSSGPHPLEDDFRLQLTVANALRWPNPSTVLFTSDHSVVQSMRSAMPTDLVSSAKVRHFPFDIANVLVQTFSPLRDVLIPLARTSNPSNDELGNVLGALISSLSRASDEVSVEALLHMAQGQSPTLIRLFPHQMAGVELAPQVVSVLDGIPGFCYCFDRGFFEWRCGSDSGVFSFSCLDHRFRRFQELASAQKPETFEDLENILGCFCE